MLGRETFNLYRSFKVRNAPRHKVGSHASPQLKNVPYERATLRELEYMIEVGVLLSGTRSATLVPYDDALYYLADIKRPQAFPNPDAAAGDAPPPSWLQTRPRIHRRKPQPWEVSRSLKMKCGTVVGGPALASPDSFADFSFDDA